MDCAHERKKTLRLLRRKTFGHLPIEISIPTKSLLDQGAQMTAKLASLSCYLSPLVQGGLEIPCFIEVFISKDQELIEVVYQEKDGRPVIWSILFCNQPHEPTDVDHKGLKRTHSHAAIKPGTKIQKLTMELILLEYNIWMQFHCTFFYKHQVNFAEPQLCIVFFSTSNWPPPMIIGLKCYLGLALLIGILTFFWNLLVSKTLTFSLRFYPHLRLMMLINFMLIKKVYCLYGVLFLWYS